MFLVLVLVCPHRKQIILTINSAALLSLPTTPPCAFDNTTNYIPLQDISHIKYFLPIISSEYLLEYNVFEISMLNVVIGNILGRSSIANCVHKLDWGQSSALGLSTLIKMFNTRWQKIKFGASSCRPHHPFSPIFFIFRSRLGWIVGSHHKRIQYETIG